MRHPQRGLGDILTTAFELYRTNAAQLIKIVAIVVVPLTFVLALLTKVALKQNCTGDNVQTFQTRRTSWPGSGTIGRSLLLGAIGWFIAVAIQQLILGSVTRGGAAAVLGRPVDVDASYRYAFSRLGGLIGLALLIVLVVFLGFFVFFIGASLSASSSPWRCRRSSSNAPAQSTRCRDRGSSCEGIGGTRFS